MTDMAGLSHFEAYFRELKDQYVIVGGVEKLTPKMIKQIVGKGVAVDKDAVVHSIEQVFVTDD